MKKKGQVQTIAPAVLLLVFASVVLVFGLIILQELRDTPIISKSATNTTVSNETLTTVTHAGEIVARVAIAEGFDNFAIIEVYSTNGTAQRYPTAGSMGSGNFSFSASAGNISFIGPAPDAQINNSDWNISYTYSAGGQPFKSGNLTITGLATFADFWEIIVLAIVITVVIGLLLVVFGGTGRRQR